MKVLLAFCGLIVLAASVPVHAGEWVYFKNGHKMLVESMREEDGIIYLKLNAGNEVGFPKNLLAEVSKTTEFRVTQQYAAARGSGRGPGFDQLLGTQQVLADMGNVQRNAALESQRMKAGVTYSYGFSYMGSEDVSRMQRQTPKTSPRQQLRDMNAIDNSAQKAFGDQSFDGDAPSTRAPLGLVTRPNKRGIID